MTISEEEFERLVEEGRQLRKARPEVIRTAGHFASFPSLEQEPVSPPYSLPWYVRRNLESLAPGYA